MKKIISPLLFVIILACGGEKIMIRNAAKGNGFIIGTLTIVDEKPKLDKIGLQYKIEGKKLGVFDSYETILITNNMKSYKSNKKTYLFIKEQKVDNYEFFNFILINNGILITSIKLKKEFSIPFSVQENSINYIGDIEFHPNGNENGNIFVIRDEFERDLPKFKEKYPRKNWAIVQNKTLKEGVINDSFIEFN